MGNIKLLGIIFILFALITAFTGEVQAEQTVDAVFPYTYEAMLQDINELEQLYKYSEAFKVFTIGYSEFGREIKAVRIGQGYYNQIIIVAGTHAREWMTTVLVMEMIDRYADAYFNESYFEGYHVKELLDNCSITFIPMLNPDGVVLQQQGLDGFSAEQQQIIRDTVGSSLHKIKQWKANALGVDLNRQQNIYWENAAKYNEIYPDYQNYRGYAPEQAQETKALVNVITNNKFDALLSYHSSGQVIDWTGCNADWNRDLALAKRIGAATGYRLLYDDAATPVGGLSPWFRSTTGNMAVTIEIGRPAGEREVRYTEWGHIWEVNKLVGLITADEAFNNYLKNTSIMDNYMSR